MGFGVGVWLTRCVVEAGAFRKPEGRGDATGLAEKSRNNFEFSILNCGTSLIKERSYTNSTFKIQRSKLSFALGLPFVPWW
jgi:hypothetical protein